MSKLSFRARALDAAKSMPIYRKDEVSDLPDYSVLNRAVPQMPTGMEKEEESEHHLQRAISAQQVYGDKKVMVIPVPEAEVGVEYYNNIYKKPFRITKQYIHNQAQALNSIMEQENPDYDMDSDDERWLHDTNKKMSLELKEIQFEEMFDRLEKSCGTQPASLQEAKLLLKEDDDLIKAVYEYWLQKRAKFASGSLTFQVRQEKRDGSSSGDSYVAFRRRTEKMQTRKNRKNDEASYEKMLKLRRDLSRAVTILEMVKRREKCKWELLHLTLEVAEKRYQMKDWDGKCLKMAKREVAIGAGNLKAITRVKHISGNKGTPGTNAATAVKQRIRSELEREKRRKSKKNKHDKLRLGLSAMAPGSVGASGNSSSALPGSNSLLRSPHRHMSNIGTAPKSPGYSSQVTYQQAVDTMTQYEFHSSDEETARPKSPLLGSVAPVDERKKNPDGIYAFRRKPGCKYNAPRDDLSGDHWPWMSDDRHKYSLTTLTMPEKCMGFCRRRVGRGGRVLMDRAYTPWNKEFREIDLHPEANHLPHDQNLQQLLEEIKHGRWRRYRPYDPMTHKAHKLTQKNNQGTEFDLKPFGHSSATVGKHSFDAKATKPRTDSSDSETVDIMTTDENFRTDLLHRRLLQKSPHMKSASPQRNKSTSQKPILVHGRQLDKPSALFAVSALVTSDSPPTHKARVKSGRSQHLKLNVVSANSPALSNNASVHSTPVAMTLIGNLPGASPGKYVSNVMTSPQSEKSSPVVRKNKTIGRFTLDHAKFYGVKGQEKVHATLMPVASLQPKSCATSVTLTVTGPSPKASLSTMSGSTSTGMVSLTMTQPNISVHNGKGATHSGGVLADTISGTLPQKSLSMPVVMATLRIGNSTSANTSTAALQTVTTANCVSEAESILTTSYSVGSQGSSVGEATNTTGTVFLTPSTRVQPSKATIGELQHVSGSLPLTLTTVNSTTLVPSQYKHATQNVLLGPQSLNLALTPATPQKHATLSQLSIPNSSGHAPAILIATAATGTLASNLPTSNVDVVANSVTTGLNVNQTKTVSINVARQILALQQQSEVGTLTVSAAQSQGAQHSGSAWVTSGSGPNILKLGPAGIPGIQIHPVPAGLKTGATNKSLTVISKRPRGQQVASNATRTINIASPRQVSANNKVSGVPSQMTLVPDNRTNLISKPLISITHPQKNSNAAAVLSAKNVPSEQSCTITSDGNQMVPTPLSTQSENVVTDNPVLNSKTSKNSQPMEVT